MRLAGPLPRTPSPAVARCSGFDEPVHVSALSNVQPAIFSVLLPLASMNVHKWGNHAPGDPWPFGQTRSCGADCRARFSRSSTRGIRLCCVEIGPDSRLSRSRVASCLDPACVDGPCSVVQRRRVVVCAQMPPLSTVFRPPRAIFSRKRDIQYT